MKIFSWFFSCQILKRFPHNVPHRMTTPAGCWRWSWDGRNPRQLGMVAARCSAAQAQGCNILQHSSSCWQLLTAANSCRVSAVSSPQLGHRQQDTAIITVHCPGVQTLERESGDAIEIQRLCAVVTWHVCQCSCVAGGMYTWLHTIQSPALDLTLPLSLYLGINQTLPPILLLSSSSVFCFHHPLGHLDSINTRV